MRLESKTSVDEVMENNGGGKEILALRRRNQLVGFSRALCLASRSAFFSFLFSSLSCLLSCFCSFMCILNASCVR